MEKNGTLIEEVDVKLKYNASLFWLNFCKKSWPVYIVTVIFTVVFTVLHIISGNVFQLYAAIIYPLFMLIYLIAEGFYKYKKIIKIASKEIKTTRLNVYSSHIEIIYITNGTQHSNCYQYDIMEDISYDPKKESYVFTIRKDNKYTVEKKEIKEETIAFFNTLLKSNQNLEN